MDETEIYCWRLLGWSECFTATVRMSLRTYSRINERVLDRAWNERSLFLLAEARRSGITRLSHFVIFQQLDPRTERVLWDEFYLNEDIFAGMRKLSLELSTRGVLWKVKCWIYLIQVINYISLRRCCKGNRIQKISAFWVNIVGVSQERWSKKFERAPESAKQFRFGARQALPPRDEFNPSRI